MSDHTVTLSKGQKVEPNVKCWGGKGCGSDVEVCVSPGTYGAWRKIVALGENLLVSLDAVFLFFCFLTEEIGNRFILVKMNALTINKK